MKNTTLPPGIDQEMIDKAKAAHGADNVFLVDLIDDEGENLLTVLLRRPDRRVIQQFELNADSDPGKAREILVNGTILSHKDEVKANDKMFAAVVNAAIELFPIRKAIIRSIKPTDPLPEGISQDMIDNAIQQKGASNVKYADLPVGVDGKKVLTVLACTPSRKAVDDHEKWDARQPNKAKNILIDAGILSHVETIKADDWLWYAAVNAVTQLKPKGTALIKNC
jgi:hypothetical protein